MLKRFLIWVGMVFVGRGSLAAKMRLGKIN